MDVAVFENTALAGPPTLYVAAKFVCAKAVPYVGVLPFTNPCIYTVPSKVPKVSHASNILSPLGFTKLFISVMIFVLLVVSLVS